jgi:hypothetical protein
MVPISCLADDPWYIFIDSFRDFSCFGFIFLTAQVMKDIDASHRLLVRCLVDQFITVDARHVSLA